MKWSYRLGRIAGIDVNIHATFALLIAFILFTHWATGQSLQAAVGGLAFVSAIFGCVLLHELGHALAARRFGIGTWDITLLPIGGVARLERMPDKPLQELWVAIAGPAVNVAIAIALYAWLVLTNQLVPMGQLGVAAGPFVERLLVVNVILIVFNMIPAFPMDGGRCVRALLALRLEYARATRIAAGVGQMIAVGFVVLGLFTNPFLLLIGVFVWIGAAQEARYATIKAALSGVPLRRALTRAVPVLDPEDSLAQAADVLGTSPCQAALVVDRGQPVGTLSARELIAGLHRHGPAAEVAEAMRRDIQEIDLETTTDAALARLQEAGASIVPVVSYGRLVGAVTLEALDQYVAIQSVLRRSANDTVDGGPQRTPKAWHVRRAGYAQ